MKATRNYYDIPDNIFGCSRDSSLKVRQRYELLSELIQKSRLHSEALGLKVQHIRVVDGVANPRRYRNRTNDPENAVIKRQRSGL